MAIPSFSHDGPQYHLSYHNVMRYPHYYVTGSQVDNLNAKIRYHKGLESMNGCFMHCHLAEIKPGSDQPQLKQQTEKIQRCLAHSQVFLLEETTRIGRAIIEEQIRRDKMLLLEIESKALALHEGQ